MTSDKPPQPAEGWYQLPADPDVERYWNGSEWTDKVRVKKNLTTSKFPIHIPPKHLKWYFLAIASIVAVLAVLVIAPIGNTTPSNVANADPTIEDACGEILSHDWYELNARVFKTGPDIPAREANAYFVEGFIDKTSKYKTTDPEFATKLNVLASYLRDLADAEQFESAAEIATKVDGAFKDFTTYCANFGIEVDSPVLSEATDNNSEIQVDEKSRIPSDYVDNGEGIAYKLTPSIECPPSQYGCTALEIFAYRDCPRGVLVYGNLFDASGSEVARTDVHSDPLVAGQSTVVYLSTGLSTAASGTPNRFICE